MRVVANSIFNFRNPKSLKLLSRLHLDLSHFGDHKFKHSFQDSLNPFNICRIGKIETCCYYLLHWSNYSTERLDLLNSIKDIDSFFLQKTPEIIITRTLPFGDNFFDSFKNVLILDTTIDYLIKTRRFDELLFSGH